MKISSTVLRLVVVVIMGVVVSSASFIFIFRNGWLIGIEEGTAESASFLFNWNKVGVYLVEVDVKRFEWWFDDRVVSLDSKAFECTCCLVIDG